MFFKKCYYAPPENLAYKTSSYLRDDSFSRTRPPITEATLPIANIPGLPPSSLPTSDLPTSPTSGLQTSSLQVPPKLASIPEESGTKVEPSESSEEVGEGSRIDTGNIRITVDVRTEVFEQDTQKDYEIV
ncbi:14664_t:CDS:1 [Cetraspora pellucida]|uniref:14664_t:CDS:1 n=1 Tax=Cetraspora pellucida TaxID=1433469 RepID=A0A9N9FBN5_9GLOM|nr:14664_t:CDS:1 [Cetraspora pellucida]